MITTTTTTNTTTITYATKSGLDIVDRAGRWTQTSVANPSTRMATSRLNKT